MVMLGGELAGRGTQQCAAQWDAAWGSFLGSQHLPKTSVKKLQAAAAASSQASIIFTLSVLVPHLAHREPSSNEGSSMR